MTVKTSGFPYILCLSCVLLVLVIIIWTDPGNNNAVSTPSNIGFNTSSDSYKNLKDTNLVPKRTTVNNNAANSVPLELAEKAIKNLKDRFNYLSAVTINQIEFSEEFREKWPSEYKYLLYFSDKTLGELLTKVEIDNKLCQKQLQILAGLNQLDIYLHPIPGRNSEVSENFIVNLAYSLLGEDGSVLVQEHLNESWASRQGMGYHSYYEEEITRLMAIKRKECINELCTIQPELCIWLDLMAEYIRSFGFNDAWFLSDDEISLYF